MFFRNTPITEKKTKKKIEKEKQLTLTFPCSVIVNWLGGGV
jgi:hypothetical protein